MRGASPTRWWFWPRCGSGGTRRPRRSRGRPFGSAAGSACSHDPPGPCCAARALMPPPEPAAPQGSAALSCPAGSPPLWLRPLPPHRSRTGQGMCLAWLLSLGAHSWPLPAECKGATPHHGSILYNRVSTLIEASGKQCARAGSACSSSHH